MTSDWWNMSREHVESYEMDAYEWFLECKKRRDLDVEMAKSVQRTKDLSEVMKGMITKGELKLFLDETCISSCENNEQGITLDCGDLSEVEFILPDNRCVCKDCFVDEMIKELGGRK